MSRDDRGWKLRRRVPSKLQNLVGKTQWVERLAGASYRKACEKAKTFGVRCDTEIQRYESQLASSPSFSHQNPMDEPGFIFELTEHEIDQIAIAYFHELEQSIRKGDGYRRGNTEENRNEILVELAEEFEEADALATGDENKSRRYPEQDITTAFHLVALKQLIKYHFLDEQAFQHTYQSNSRRGPRECTGLKLTSDLRQNPSFQRVADRLSEASAEIARRRLEAVSERRYPTLQSPLYSPALEHFVVK